MSMLKSPMYPALRAIFWIRSGMWCWRHGLKPVALWCKSRAVRAAGVEVHPGAAVGPGLNMVHTVGIVVGKDVVAGRDLVLHQGVTLGHDGSASGQPRLGNTVRIGAHAVVLGPVRVGEAPASAPGPWCSPTSRQARRLWACGRPMPQPSDEPAPPPP